MLDRGQEGQEPPPPPSPEGEKEGGRGEEEGGSEEVSAEQRSTGSTSATRAPNPPIWIREDDNDLLRKEAAGLSDMFLDLYRDGSQ
jgi:hypothetical protein